MMPAISKFVCNSDSRADRNWREHRPTTSLPTLFSGQVVILLHGLFATHRSMVALQRSLECAGFSSINWGYPTLWHDVSAHARALLPLVEQLEQQVGVRHIHFVTHSMGGIVARCVLAQRSFAKLGRMVMLAPPNAGSYLTRIPLGPLASFLPSIGDLSDAPTGLPQRLGDPNGIEVGVIAAAADCIVPVKSTHLRTQRDHFVVRTRHMRLPKNRKAIDQVLHFLENGQFQQAMPARSRMAA